MAPDVETPRNRGTGGVPWVMVIAVAVITFVLGGWAFRSKSPPPGTGSAPAVAPGPGAIQPKKAEAVEIVAGKMGSGGTMQDERLAVLRQKLSGSVADALSALAEIGKTQPALAIDLAHALGRTDEEKSAWVKISMQQWADQDAQAAWQWLRGLSFDRMDELAGGELHHLVLGTMAARDPAMVLANIDVLLRAGNSSESISTPVALHVGLQALVEHEKVDLARKAVEDWARDPARFELGEASFATVAMAMAKDAPEDTGEWLKSMPPSEDRNAAFASLAAVWAEKDPTGALRWAESIPLSEGQHDAIGRTVSDWVERHPTEIAAWLGDYLGRVPADASSDQLIVTVMNLSPLVKANPQLALKWSELLSDPDTRRASEEKVALRWGRQDTAAAIDFVRRSMTIPSGQKLTLIQKIQDSQSSEIPED